MLIIILLRASSAYGRELNIIKIFASSRGFERQRSLNVSGNFPGWVPRPFALAAGSVAEENPWRGIFLRRASPRLPTSSNTCFSLTCPRLCSANSRSSLLMPLEMRRTYMSRVSACTYAHIYVIVSVLTCALADWDRSVPSIWGKHWW